MPQAPADPHVLPCPAGVPWQRFQDPSGPPSNPAVTLPAPRSTGALGCRAARDLQGTPQPAPLPAVPIAARTNGHPRGDRRRDLGLPPDSASTVLSSELESSSFIDSEEDDNTSRWARAGVRGGAGRVCRVCPRACARVGRGPCWWLAVLGGRLSPGLAPPPPLWPQFPLPRGGGVARP